MHSQQGMNSHYDEKRGFHPDNASDIVVANDVGVRQQTLWCNPMVNDQVDGKQNDQHDSQDRLREPADCCCRTGRSFVQDCYAPKRWIAKSSVTRTAIPVMATKRIF